jgi:hypothetical protein
MICPPHKSRCCRACFYLRRRITCTLCNRRFNGWLFWESRLDKDGLLYPSKT